MTKSTLGENVVCGPAVDGVETLSRVKTATYSLCVTGLDVRYFVAVATAAMITKI